MRPKFTLLLVVVVTIVLAATGLTHAKTKVTIGLSGGDVLFPEEMRRWFEEEHPQYDVEWLLIGWGDMVQRIPTMAAGGAAPDVWYGEAGYAMEWGFNGIAQDLAPFVERDLVKEDYYLIDAVQDAEGRIWGIPGDFQVTAMFYNPTLFDAAGLQYPFADWTVADMLEMAEKLVRYDGTQPTQYGLTGHWHSISVGWGLWIKLLGGKLLDETRTRSLFNSSETIQALEEMSSWVFERNVIPKPGEGGFALFNNNLAMEPYIYVRTRNAITANFESYDVQVTPAGPNGERFTTVVPNVWVLNGASSPEQQEAAWDWVKFALSTKVQAYRALQGHGVPVTRDAAWEFLGMPAPPDNRQAFLDSFAFAQTLEENAVWGLWAPAVWTHLSPLFQGTDSAVNVAERVHQEVENILRSVYE